MSEAAPPDWSDRERVAAAIANSRRRRCGMREMPIEQLSPYWMVPALADADAALAMWAGRGAMGWRLVDGGHFGAFAKLDMPVGTDRVCLFRDREQHEPTAIYLPHQLSVGTLGRHLKGCHSVTLVPYRNGDKVEITRDQLDAAVASLQPAAAEPAEA